MTTPSAWEATFTELGWGCSSSTAFVVFAASEALAAHFSYRPTTGKVDRGAVGADAFFAAVQADLDAPTPRPILMALENAERTMGHAIVVDGYQTGPPSLAHVNLGFGACYQGWYNPASSWLALSAMNSPPPRPTRAERAGQAS